MTSPIELYGDEFICKPVAMNRADGRVVHWQDIGVCILPLETPEATLDYAWSVMRGLASWASVAFVPTGTDHSFRIVIAWSKRVRPLQGHIFKVWVPDALLTAVAQTERYEDLHRVSDAYPAPMPHWEKGVFGLPEFEVHIDGYKSWHSRRTNE